MRTKKFPGLTYDEHVEMVGYIRNASIELEKAKDLLRTRFPKTRHGVCANYIELMAILTQLRMQLDSDYFVAEMEAQPKPHRLLINGDDCIYSAGFIRFIL